MKIRLTQISAEGLFLREQAEAKSLDLETDEVKFSRPIRIEAWVTVITNAVTVEMLLDAAMQLSCGRCLNKFEINLKKNLKLHYHAVKAEQVIDFDPQIREEIILEYPIKPLCKPGCKGLCPKCGMNLNEKKCNCTGG